MSLVLDSSVTLAWVYSDETTDAILSLFDIIKGNGAWVPGLWRWEIANVLQLNARRKRHDAEFRDAALSSLSQLPVRVDPEAERQAWEPTVRLAERHRLTVYDASYLELALRRGLPLATLDEDLRTAARAERVPLLGG
jgi:predicted nucleic acid-binding protein